MLENAPRQVLLVLAVLIASIALFATIPQPIGLDLKGGTALTYKVDFEEAIDNGILEGPLSRTDRDEVMNQTVSILKERIDPTDTLAIVIVRRGDNGILIELPDMTEGEAAEVEKRIGTLGALEMRIVANDAYTKNGVTFDIAEEKRRLTEWLAKPENREAVREDPRRIRLFNALGEDRGGRQSPKLKWYPSLVQPSVDDDRVWGGGAAFSRGQGASNPYVPAYDAAEWNGGRRPEDAPRYLVEFLPINEDEVHFTGKQLDPAGVNPRRDSLGRPALGYVFKGEFRTDYANWSEEYVGQNSAIILNGFVESDPVFQSAIDGPGIIRGDFTIKEVTELAKVLRTGSLQVKPILESRVEIGATLGSKSIWLGQLSMAIGGGLVLAFILWFYRLAGLVAFGAIILNVVILLAAMRFLQATLTLPGIAGLVLTVGMAVDANILIYERIREELERGKELLQAARTGFERAMVTILDANVTTFLAGVVLYNVGVGPVRGFAVTLMVGIATTLFTAFFVSRLIFHYLLEKNLLKGFSVHSLSLPKLDFVGASGRAMTASAIVIIGGLVYVFGFVSADTALGLDFTGGANLHIVLKEPVETATIRKELSENETFTAEFPRPVVNHVGGTVDGKSDEFAIKIKLRDSLRREIADAEREARRDGTEYTPPYVVALREAIGDRLVDEAFSDPSVQLNPDSDINDFAAIQLHFRDDVPVATVRDQLSKVATAEGDKVVVRAPGAGEAATPAAAADLVVEWDVGKGTSPGELFPLLADALTGLKDGAGNAIKLSNPIPESNVIQGQLVDELRNYAIAALLIAMALIVFFVRIRFHEFSYGYAAVAALVHDVLVTMTVVIALNSWGIVTAEIDLAMIAAFMTIIGYSINDTIVVFDRVRENLTESRRLGENVTFGSVLNRSINQTLSRTILTSCTTLFVVVSLFVVNYGAGSATLEGFSLALVIGVISGTYSTMFIATPIVLWIRAREELRAPKEDAEEAQPSPAA